MAADGVAQLKQPLRPLRRSLADEQKRLDPDVFHPPAVEHLADPDCMEHMLRVLKPEAQRLHRAVRTAVRDHLHRNIFAQHRFASFEPLFYYISFASAMQPPYPVSCRTADNESLPRSERNGGRRKCGYPFFVSDTARLRTAGLRPFPPARLPFPQSAQEGPPLSGASSPRRRYPARSVRDPS